MTHASGRYATPRLLDFVAHDKADPKPYMSGGRGNPRHIVSDVVDCFLRTPDYYTRRRKLRMRKVKYELIECKVCGGKGYELVQDPNVSPIMDAFARVKKTCENCQGTGKKRIAIEETG